MRVETGLVQIHSSGAIQQNAPAVRLFQSRRGQHLFVIRGSRVYDLDDETGVELQHAFEAGGDTSLTQAAATLLGDAPETERFRTDAVRASFPLRSLSLNLAQACNLGCHYCYADGGNFGTPETLMSLENARASIDFLLEQGEHGTPVVIGFMGGEPLLHRKLLHASARYASEQGALRGIPVQFSITTNATLLTPEDARLFAEFDWTVQISLDGTQEFHDRQRPAKDGRSAYALTMRGLSMFDRYGRPRRLLVKSSIAHGWDCLAAQLEHLISLGFDDAGFSPVLASSTQGWALNAADLERFLREIIECGEIALERWKNGKPYPFSNLITALNHIHKGTHQPYPCGAGAGYLSVDAKGDLFACHRFINDDRMHMGSVKTGLDYSARGDFLTSRHVDSQQPCVSCWAKYLCGGGCHHEVLHVGRVACDYVRGWLDFCLRAYVEIEERHYLPS